MVAFLASDEGTSEVRAVQRMLQQMGVHSIPTFVLGATSVVSGAARHTELTAALRELEQASEAGAPRSVFAEALGIPERVLQEPLVLS